MNPPQPGLRLIACALASPDASENRATRDSIAAEVGADAAETFGTWSDVWRLVAGLGTPERPVSIAGLTLAAKPAGVKAARLLELSQAIDDAVAPAWPEILAEARAERERAALQDAVGRAAQLLASGAPVDQVRETLAAVPQAAPRGAQFLGGKNLAGRLIDDAQERAARAASGRLAGIRTGFPSLDRLTSGLQRGELAILGGRTSHGKSALAGSIAAFAAIESPEPVPVVFVSLEMSALALGRRLAAQLEGLDLKAMRDGELTQVDLARFGKAVGRIRRAPLTLCDDRHLRGLEAALAAMRCEVRRTQAGLVIVDYLQKLRPAGRVEKMTYAIAEVSDALQGFAQAENVAVLALAQVNREPEKASKPGEDPRPPRLSDLADSSAIERDADLVLLLDRPPHSTEGNLLIAKGRDCELGVVPLEFRRRCTRFVERGRPRPE